MNFITAINTIVRIHILFFLNTSFMRDFNLLAFCHKCCSLIGYPACYSPLWQVMSQVGGLPVLPFKKKKNKNEPVFLFSFEQQVDLILKQLVYSLLNSMQDSLFALRPCQPFYDKNTTCRLVRSFILITCLLGQLLILSEGSFWLLWKFEK